MAKVTIGFGIVLIILGAAGYAYTLSTPNPSMTALIPAFLGVVFCGLGIGGISKPAANKHFMHGAAVLALLGVFGTARGVVGLVQWGLGTEPARPAAVVVQSIMCLLCAIFIGLCVRSFIAARRARTLS
jgi:hypothetical protein